MLGSTAPLAPDPEEARRDLHHAGEEHETHLDGPEERRIAAGAPLEVELEAEEEAADEHGGERGKYDRRRSLSQPLFDAHPPHASPAVGCPAALRGAGPRDRATSGEEASDYLPYAAVAAP